MMSQRMREECRTECLGYLVCRPVVAYDVAAIRRGVNGVDYDFTPEEIREALEYLLGLGLVTTVRHSLGATPFYKATSKGVQHVEYGGAK